MSFEDLVVVTALLYPRPSNESSSSLYGLGVVVPASLRLSEEAARRSRRRRRCIATVMLFMRVGSDLSKMMEACKIHRLAPII